MTLRDQLGRVRWRKGKGFLQGDLITRGRNRTSSWVASLPMQSVLSNLPPWSHDWARPRRNTKSTTDATKKKNYQKLLVSRPKKLPNPEVESFFTGNLVRSHNTVNREKVSCCDYKGGGECWTLVGVRGFPFYWTFFFSSHCTVALEDFCRTLSLWVTW